MHPIRSARVTGLVLSASCLLAVTATLAAEDLVVHEWGTFTSLQNARGDTLGDLNVDEEALPEFVHDLMPGVLHRDVVLSPVMHLGKGMVVPGHDVTMRLETPVIYFHPPPGAPPMALDVEVSFLGGVLSQFYPAAAARAPGQLDEQGHFIVDPLGSTTRSTLTWRFLRVGVPDPDPERRPADQIALRQTFSPIWLAPRKVSASDIVAGWSAERERFLFYRGLGHRDAPVRVTASADRQRFEVRARGDLPSGAPGGATVPAWWVADIRADGATAFRELASATLGRDPEVVITTFPSGFAAGDYSAGNRSTLALRMHAALRADGLFDDEATALLATWEASYFRSPGMRLFFLVPPAWTDAVLPLRITRTGGQAVPHTRVRTMVGRIELVSPHQQELLAAMASNPGLPGDLAWWTAAWHRTYDGKPVPDETEHTLLQSMLHDAEAVPGVKVPPAFTDFVALGRFREALVIDAARSSSMRGLKTFMATYGIE